MIRGEVPREGLELHREAKQVLSAESVWCFDGVKPGGTHTRFYFGGIFMILIPVCQEGEKTGKIYGAGLNNNDFKRIIR